MKSVYDKHFRNHNFAVGDHVMLWFPSHQRGISQCFQARWKEPWVITEIIGNTNCRLCDEKGSCKYVHMNQLKKVQIRDRILQGEQEHPQIDSDIVNDRTNVFELLEENDESNDDDDLLIVPRYPIENAWVDIDRSYILPTRTRSLARRGMVLYRCCTTPVTLFIIDCSVFKESLAVKKIYDKDRNSCIILCVYTLISSHILSELNKVGNNS